MARDETSVSHLGAQWADYLVSGNDRSVDGREDGTVPAGHAVDVQFLDFMAAPSSAIAEVYAALRLELTDEAEQAMKQFLADNPVDKHGVHRYTFAATALDVGGTRRRTERYERYFDVPREDL
jgi:hypothetical protein